MKWAMAVLSVILMLAAGTCGAKAFIGHPLAMAYGIFACAFLFGSAYFGFMSVLFFLKDHNENKFPPDYEDGQLDITAGSIKFIGGGKK